MEKNNAFKNLASSFEKFGKDAFDIHDQCGTLRNIAEDIANRRDREMALEFTKQIAEFLVANGVTAQIEEYKHEDYADNSFECRYGYAITGLDFTEHDSKFKEKITQLKRDINKKDDEINQLKAELSKKVDFETDRLVKLPFDALETANMLINATYMADIPFFERKIDEDIYSIDDLEQIAEHLMVYCKHNRE